MPSCVRSFAMMLLLCLTSYTAFGQAAANSDANGLYRFALQSADVSARLNAAAFKITEIELADLNISGIGFNQVQSHEPAPAATARSATGPPPGGCDWRRAAAACGAMVAKPPSASTAAGKIMRLRSVTAVPVSIRGANEPLMNTA